MLIFCTGIKAVNSQRERLNLIWSKLDWNADYSHPRHFILKTRTWSTLTICWFEGAAETRQLVCNFSLNFEKLPSVTYWEQLVSQFLVAASAVESRTWFYFSQRLRRRLYWRYAVQHLPSLQLVSQCSLVLFGQSFASYWPIRILVILSSVLLGRSFASCCSPIAQCNTPVRATEMLRS